jgi:hypothetical protein
MDDTNSHVLSTSATGYQKGCRDGEIREFIRDNATGLILSPGADPSPAAVSAGRACSRGTWKAIPQLAYANALAYQNAVIKRLRP